jgi:hypothetical protein
MAKMSPALVKAQKKYNRTKTRSFIFKFNKGTDADVIERLEKAENKQGYIKALIRKDIEK